MKKFLPRSGGCNAGAWCAWRGVRDTCGGAWVHSVGAGGGCARDACAMRVPCVHHACMTRGKKLKSQCAYGIRRRGGVAGSRSGARHKRVHIYIIPRIQCSPLFFDDPVLLSPLVVSAQLSHFRQGPQTPGAFATLLTCGTQGLTLSIFSCNFASTSSEILKVANSPGGFRPLSCDQSNLKATRDFFVTL